MSEDKQEKFIKLLNELSELVKSEMKTAPYLDIGRLLMDRKYTLFEIEVLEYYFPSITDLTNKEKVIREIEEKFEMWDYTNACFIYRQYIEFYARSV